MNARIEHQSKLLKWLQPSGREWGTDPGQMEPEWVREVVERLNLFFGPGRYFRVSVDGWENLPDEPSFLISNHSGGTSIPDVWGLCWAWNRHFDYSRVCHPLAHEMVFSNAVTGRFFSRLGVLKASRNRAVEVIEQWQRDVLVMPGGDRDTWRPYQDRYKVNFAGRRGYARLALKMGKAVVPVANAGAHESLVVLTDGRRIARRIGLHSLARADVFPIHLSLPWGLGIGPLPHLPVPVRLRYRIGAPVALPESLRPGQEPTPEQIAAYDQRVQAAVQALLNQLRADRHMHPGAVSTVGRKAVRRIRRRIQHRMGDVSRFANDAGRNM